jgi:hypothetical protein
MSITLSPTTPEIPKLAIWNAHWCGAIASQVIAGLGGKPNTEWNASGVGNTGSLGEAGSRVMGGYVQVQVLMIEPGTVMCLVQYNASGEEKSAKVFSGGYFPIKMIVSNLLESLAKEGIVNMQNIRTAASQKHWGDGNPSAPSTPWGPAQSGTQIESGVWLFGTAGHGGLMVRPGAAQKKLSPAARKCGLFWGGAYWFEEDVAIRIPLFENFDWARALGSRVTPEQNERYIRESSPEYFQYLAAGHVEPSRVKVGDKLVFREAVNYGQGLRFQAGDLGTVTKTTPAMIIFIADKYHMKFKVPVAYVLDGKVAKA